jgi:hypothetical protein
MDQADPAAASKPPAPVARAVVDRWMAAALALAGLGFAGFDALAVRPEMLSLARSGRRATGTVVASGGTVKSVEVLCSTPTGRCEPLARVAAYERWPRTPGMIRAGALLGAAGVMAVFARRRRAPG